MPIGSIQTYGEMVVQLAKYKLSSVLDIGIGMGANGLAVRNWLELGYAQEWRINLVGVEAFGEYNNPTWQLYNEIIIGDIIEVVASLGKYDAIVMTDVIEHLDKRPGVRLLEVLKGLVNQVLFVSTPAAFFRQGAVHGNEYEIHRCAWRAREFEAQGFKILNTGKPGHLGARMIAAYYEP